MKKILAVVILVLAVIFLGLHAIGSGWFGEPWQSEEVVAGPRPLHVTAPASTAPQVLFGDLHTHTNYSLDAYLFNTALIKNIGVVTPADACDFARYCSALDFWSINDHAEGLTPRVWADSVEAIRECNAQAGDPSNPDMVSFVGWEWSNSEKDDVPSHYGHKNVVFRTWEAGQTPTRPIASTPQYAFARVPSVFVGLAALKEELGAVSSMGWYLSESKDTPVCASDVSARDLPDDCREVAFTPSELYQKLDEWGYDSLVIPHGLAWGTTNPLTADFRNQLDEYEFRYQKLLETFSGHGNSEVFEDFVRVERDAGGEKSCPAPTENFTPCCHQAGLLAIRECNAKAEPDCDAKGEAIKRAFVEKGIPAGRKLLANASLDDWAGCGHLQESFQPASMYVPKQSTQYNLALGFDENGAPKRAKFGLIGSSDNHQARPGSSYKETNRVMYTDNKSVTGEPTWSYTAAKESGAFYYTGGLVAVHSASRHRDDIWEALDRRQVYATSGDRMLAWFDLLNGPSGQYPMGSEVVMNDAPRFRVKALGAFEQLEGCPDYAVAALGKDRIESLCGGECYRVGDRRKPIVRIEIVRIRPQIEPTEAIADLIDDRWRVFDCPATGEGCTIEFEDEEYVGSGRPSLYYARVIQAAEPLIGGDPFGCERDERGRCLSRTYCIDENAGPDENCTALAEPRAWTSPIFLEPASGSME